jgi:hypothetical protein
MIIGPEANFVSGPFVVEAPASSPPESRVN